MLAGVGKERSALSRLRKMVIGSEFCRREPFCTIVLQEAYVGPKILFHDGIGILSLAISFRVKRCGQVRLDIEAGAQLVPKLDTEE